MFCLACLRLWLVTAWRLWSRVSIYPLQHRLADDSWEVDNDDGRAEVSKHRAQHNQHLKHLKYPELGALS